jgi:hypothetical protein
VNDEVAVCLDGKEQLSNAGDEERIENSGDKRKQEKNYERWSYLVPDNGCDFSVIHMFFPRVYELQTVFGKGVLLVVNSGWWVYAFVFL